MSIGVAILGSGIFVREEHLPAVLATPAFTLRALYSRSSASAKAVLQESSLSKIDIYSDDSPTASQLNALLSRSDIHAVIIALPITAQPRYITAALKAGKHVLSEKPVGATIAAAQELLAFYASLKSNRPIWAVAEQFRYFARFQYAAEQVQTLGRVIGFRMRLSTLVKPGMKYLETEWRKTPDYQGGFLLDGGVHFIAGIRAMLGPDAKMSRVCAFTAQNQEYLLPVDTVDGTVRLSNGATGTIGVSFGTTFEGAEWTVACEKGTVAVDGDVVTVKEGEKTKEEKFDPKESGVTLEVQAFAKSIEAGKADPAQVPEEALGDLEVLESLLKSGEADGAPVDLKLQT